MRRIPGWMLYFPMLSLGVGCPPAADDSASPPDTTPAECPEGTVADGEDCVPEACGAGRWGDLPVGDGTVYVDIAAGEGGDGSEAAPFSTIQAGADAAGAAGGGLVAIAAGTYAETVIVADDHAGVSLAGRCAEMVTLDASVGGSGDAGLTIDTSPGTLDVSGLTVQDSPYIGVFVVSGVVTLRNVRISTASYAGLYVMGPTIGAATSVLAEDCELTENVAAGVHIDGARVEVTLRRVLVQDSQRGGVNLPGVGIGVVGGATLHLEDSELARNRAEGLLIREAATVEVRDSVIHGTFPDGSGLYGYGIQVSGGASLTVEGSEIAENTHAGVNVVEAGTQAVIRDTRIRDTQPTSDGLHGSGIEVGGGASLVLEDSELSGFRVFGVGVTGEGSEARIRSTALHDALEGDLELGGIGILALDRASVQVEGCTLADLAGMGIAALEAGSAVVVSDTEVRDTWTVGSVGQYGIGLAAGIGGSLEASGCEISGSGTIGVLVANEGSSATLDEVRIADTRKGDAYTVGVGAAVVDGAVLTAQGLSVEGCEGPGLYAMSVGTVLDCEHCTIEGAEFAGLVAEQGAAVTLTEARIADTSVASNVGGGVGIQALAAEGEPTSLEVVDSAIAGNPIGGVWLAGPGRFLLEGNDLGGGEGEVRGSLVRCGDAVYARDVAAAWDGSQGLYLSGNTLRDGHGAGLFLDAATATLGGNTWSSNAVDLVAQGSSCATAPAGLDGEPVGSAELCPTWDYSTCGDAFELYVELALPEGT